MKAVIYCRVSTKEQVENFSLESQEKYCREYAKRNGYEVVEKFVDKGESAKTVNRPRFLEMIEYCRKNKNKIQAVIVYKIDRFARNTYDHYVIRGKLKLYGTTLLSATEAFDDSPMGHAMESMATTLAQLDNDNKAERSKVGLKARFEKGLWSWGAPLGYKNVKKANGQKIVIPDPEISPLITLAFNEFAKGIYTKVQITRKLQRRGLRAKTGRKVWPQLVGKMLKNKFYAGYIYSKKWKEEKEANHKPLTDLATFLKVQQILQGKTFLAVPHIKCREEYPLRGFAKCPICTHFLTASQSRGHGGKYHYYHCHHKPRHGSSYSKGKVEEEFTGYLTRVKPDEARLRLFKEVVVDLWDSKRKEAGKDIGMIENKLDKLEEDMHKTIKLVRDEVIKPDMAKRELDDLQEQIDLFKLEKNELSADEFNVRTTADKCVAALRKPHDYWLNLKTVEQRQRFQRLIFPDGVVYENPGFRTSKIGLLFELSSAKYSEKSSLVRPVRVELTTFPLEAGCSVH